MLNERVLISKFGDELELLLMVDLSLPKHRTQLVSEDLD